MDDFDCIFIPGGGLLPGGLLPPWTVARLDSALDLQHQTRWIALLSGGTVHKPPPLNGQGRPVFESRAAADFLVEAGLDSRRVLTEICSYDTIGNAYFSRLLFAEPLGLRKFLVITSNFHLVRTQAAFDWIYQLTPQPLDYQCKYIAVTDRGLAGSALKSRLEKEKKSLVHLEQTRKGITTLAGFTAWLYTEHAAYAPGKEIGSLPSDLLTSY